MNKKEIVNSSAARQENPSTAGVANVIPIIEETATVEKRIVESGRVRISKQARELETTVDVPLLHEEVSVERVPVNKVVEERLPTRYDGDTLIIPVIEEQIVLEKRLVLVEELHVRKQVVESSETKKITLLKEEVDVTRSAGNEGSGSKSK